MIPAIPAALAIGGGLAGAIGGSIASSGSRSAANAAAQSALQQWLSIHVPDPSKQRIELERYQQTGQFSPELQKVFQQSETGLKNLQVDPTGRAAEIAALSQMQDVAASGGMDAQAREKLNEGIIESNVNEKANREAINQSFARRGMGNSGVALASKLIAGQEGANRAARTGVSAAADAESRALQAMMNSATLGGRVSDSDYNRSAAAAKAQDEINRFNTQNSQRVAGENTGALNEAQKYNFNNAQDVSNRNVGLGNEEERFNQGLSQKQFDNEMGLARGVSGGYQGVENQENRNAQNTANMWSGIGGAISQAGGTLGQYSNSKKKSTSQDDEE